MPQCARKTATGSSGWAPSPGGLKTGAKHNVKVQTSDRQQVNTLSRREGKRQLTQLFGDGLGCMLPAPQKGGLGDDVRLLALLEHRLVDGQVPLEGLPQAPHLPAKADQGFVGQAARRRRGFREEPNEAADVQHVVLDVHHRHFSLMEHFSLPNCKKTKTVTETIDYFQAEPTTGEKLLTCVSWQCP